MVLLIKNEKALQEMRLELARKSFKEFVRYAWDILEPGKELKASWYLDAICDHLQAISENKLKRLIINIPPRHLKSSLVSVLWPAWEWLRYPRTRYLTSSYGKHLAERDAVRSRQVMVHPKYKRLLQREDKTPAWTFTSDQNLKGRYVNNMTGWRITTSVGAGATGEGGDRIIVDDPNEASDAGSEVQRKLVHDWWDMTMSTRLNDPKTGSKLVIQQRIHHDDLTGHLLEQGGYELLCLPLMYEDEHPHKSVTSLGFRDPRKEDGELLCEAHFGEKEVAAAQQALGTFAFVGQYQQRPTPGEGATFKKAWFNYWTSLPARWDVVFMSWDLSFKGKDERTGPKAEIEQMRDPSYVVGDLWGVVGAKAYLLDQVRGQWDFNTTLQQFVSFYRLHPNALKKLIESKANGPALVNVLKDKIPGLIEVEPEGSKIQRALSIVPFVEAGNILIPHPTIHKWSDEWLEEVTSFPFAKHNDRVDTMSQAIIHVFIRNGTGVAHRLNAIGSVVDDFFKQQEYMDL